MGSGNSLSQSGVKRQRLYGILAIIFFAAFYATVPTFFLVGVLSRVTLSQFIANMDLGGSISCGIVILLFAWLIVAGIRTARRRKWPATLIWQMVGFLIAVCLAVVFVIFIIANFNNNFDGTRDYPVFHSNTESGQSRNNTIGVQRAWSRLAL